MTTTLNEWLLLASKEGQDTQVELATHLEEGGCVALGLPLHGGQQEGSVLHTLGAAAQRTVSPQPQYGTELKAPQSETQHHCKMVHQRQACAEGEGSRAASSQTMADQH